MRAINIAHLFYTAAVIMFGIGLAIESSFCLGLGNGFMVSGLIIRLFGLFIHPCDNHDPS